MTTLLVPSVRSKGARGTNTPAIPAVTSGNDTMVVKVTGSITVAGGGPSIAGFTRLLAIVGGSGTGRYMATFLKRLTGPEAAGNYTITATNATIGASQAYCVKDTETSGPLYNAWNSFNTVTGGSVPLPVTSGLNIGDFAMWDYCSTGATITVTPPAGWIEESDTAAAVFHVLSQIEDHTATDGDAMTATGTTLGGLTTLVTLPARVVADPPPVTTRVKDSAGTLASVTIRVKGSDGSIVTAVPYYKNPTGQVIAL